MFSLRKKVSDNLILFILVSFAFMSVLGMGIGMEITDGQISSCPFMTGQATMCQMKITEHIVQWQQAFLGIPNENFLALAILLLAVVLIPFAKLFSKLKELAESAARLFAYHKTHLVKVFDPLVLAFADGILNPKIYDSRVL